MKNKYKLFVLSVAGLLVSACNVPSNTKPDNGNNNNGNNNNGENNVSHTHNWSDTYEKDSNYHWFKCLDDDCDEVKDKESHDYEGSDWVIDSYASGTTQGTKHRVCNDCGYQQTESHNETDPNAQGGSGGGNNSNEHTHTYDTNWTSDDSYHWHKCTVTVGGMSFNGMTFGGTPCDAIKDKAAHTWNSGEVTTAPGAYSEGVKTYKCTVCNKTKTESIPATGPVDEKVGNFSFNNDITVAQKIHTTNQEKFLNFTGDYYNITSSQLNSYSATGNSEASFPNQVKVTWNYTAPTGKTVKNYTVITGQKPDLSDGYQMTATSTQLSFYNAFLGTNYFKVIANLSDNTTEASPIKTFLVDATAPRNLKVGTMSNCRDMGGRTTTAGGKIKQGLIYRTSDPATSGVGDVSEWTKRMKIKTEIYVKDGSNSSGPLGSSVKFVNASMDYGATPKSNMARNAERLRKVFSVLGDSSNYPVMYHCRIGTDRTGICAVAINGLLGVPFNEIIQDYSFSNFGKIDGQRYAHKTPDNNGDDIAKYIDEILALPGNDFQQKMTYALLSIGVPSQTLQNVVDLLTDGNKVTIPSDISLFNGTKLTNNGGTKKTSSDFSAPETYYEISGSSKSVSCTYNLTEAKEVSVIAYLGCTNSSSSTKLASGIDLKIDGASKTIFDKTYFDAGFGTTGQSRRTGYMFSVLGKYSLTAGNHTITISGKNSDTFNIGSIAIVGGGSNAGSSSGSSTGGSSTGGSSTGGSSTGGSSSSSTTPIKFMVSASSGYKDPSAKMKTDAIWAVNSTTLPAGNYKVSVEFKLSTGGSEHEGKTLMENNTTPYYTLKIGSTSIMPSDTTSTRSSLGINASSFTDVTYAASVNVPSGTAQISLCWTGSGYSMMINSVTFTAIA
ncbi:MAG: tyrosine-protein phosphatase [Bacilli bacterium]|nr:tyrosine-protein phosphatase [Bacilli bacterium]